MGSLCVVSGVITIALLVPVVVSNFSTYYSHEKGGGGGAKTGEDGEELSTGPAQSGCTQS